MEEQWVLQPKMELPERSHGQTYWGRNFLCFCFVLVDRGRYGRGHGRMGFIPERLIMIMMTMTVMVYQPGLPTGMA